MFFYLSKTLQFFADPGNAFLIALFIGTQLASTRFRVFGRICVAMAVTFSLLVTFLPIGSWMSSSIERRFPVPKTLPQKIDGIAVLGGVIDPMLSKLHGTPAINGAVERITVSAALAQRYPAATLIYSGGSGSLIDTEAREADYVAELYGQLGIAADRLVLERNARNTVENAKEMFKLAKPAPDQTWLLVTSAMHMPRAVGVFRQLGWELIPYPVDFHSAPETEPRAPMSFTPGLSSFASALREWIGLFAYWLTGHTDAAFPEPRPKAGG